ncbi:MAG: class I SAM-dependent methyltransferase [Candidatus Brocadiae bacterium]|nr:class I SAM-dependent methyltransferase [Candidatus Brocadiia bacterium]
MTGEDATGWEAAYRKRPSGGYRKASQHEDCQALDRVFRDRNVRAILDLGCGDGRHLVFFARRGYLMHGQDIAPTAIRLADEWLAGENLSADLKAGDMTHIRWPDASFDAMLCIQVVNHHRIRQIRQTVAEIHRVLREGGLLFLTVATERRPPRPGAPKAVEVEPHTYVPLEGHEKGVPHHQFDTQELRYEFRRFIVCEDVMPVHKDSKGYTCLVMQKPDNQ